MASKCKRTHVDSSYVCSYVKRDGTYVSGHKRDAHYREICN